MVLWKPRASCVAVRADYNSIFCRVYGLYGLLVVAVVSVCVVWWGVLCMPVVWRSRRPVVLYKLHDNLVHASNTSFK